MVKLLGVVVCDQDFVRDCLPGPRIRPVAGDERLSLSSGLWRNIDGTASCSARSTVTLVSAPFPELPGGQGEQSSSSGRGAADGADRGA